MQIAEYGGGRQRIVQHIGSAHTEAELGVLLARARELLEDPAQGVLDLGIEPTPPVAPLVRPAAEPALLQAPREAPIGGRGGPGRVVGTDSRLLFETLKCGSPRIVEGSVMRLPRRGPLCWSRS